MTRAVVALLGVVAIGSLAGLAFVGGAVPGVDGCTLRSVDKREYVAENEAIFSTIPIPPLLSNANKTRYSVGITAMDACLPVENGPPYDRYITWHVYTQDPGGRPIGFDRRVLDREWVSQLAGAHEDVPSRARVAVRPLQRRGGLAWSRPSSPLNTAAQPLFAQRTKRLP